MIFSASSITYSGTPWVFLLPMLAYTIGRKKSHLLVSFTTFVAYLIFYFSQNVTHILISQLFQGPLAASYLTTSIVTVTEYSSSRYRGIFLTFKSASFFWGVLVANAIGMFVHWRILGIVGVTCSIYNLVSIFIWPESPYWLASKRRFQECIESHRWIKGRSKVSELELERLLKANETKGFIVERLTVKKILNTLVQKDFWRPVLMSCLLACLYSFTGKMFCSVFALDILKKMTNDEKTAYTSMLILDAVTVASMYIGCVISRVMKRRTMLFAFSSIGISFLLSTSIYLFLVNSDVVSDNIYVAIPLLTGYSITIGSGPMILATSIIGELLPFESKSLSMCIIALVFKAVFGTFMKISPYCFKYLKLHGTFLMFSLLSVGVLILIYIYVPETKDKTLQEIDDAIKKKNVKDGAEASELMPIRTRTQIQN